MFANLLSSILNFFIFSVTCQSFFEMNISKKKYILIQLIIVSFKSIISIQGNPQLNFVSSLITSIILLFFFKGTFIHKSLLLIFYALINVICELLSLKINTLFFSKEEVLNTQSIAYFSGILLSNFFLILLIKILSIYIKTFKLPSLPKYFGAIFILPTTTILMILAISDYYEVTARSNYFVFILLGLLLSNLICIYVFYLATIKIINENELDKKIHKTKIKLETAEKILNQQDLFFNNIRKQSIDMIELLDHQKLTELKEYIQNIYQDTANTYNMINTNYDLLDMIINDRLFILKNNQIEIKSILQTTHFFGYDFFELESFFCYLIDLATHESLKNEADSRKIQIVSKPFEQMTLLTLSFQSYSKNTEEIKNKIEKDLHDFISKQQLNYLVSSEISPNMISISFIFNQS